MTPREIEDALGGMVILVDTREQDTPRLRARLKGMECPHERCKLDFGDYSAKFPIGGEWLTLNAAIERKMDFSELAQCFCNGRENQNWEDAYSGNYRSQMKPQAFVASLLAWLARYRCQIIFCDQRTSGKLIHDILYREGREMLERMMLSECET